MTTKIRACVQALHAAESAGSPVQVGAARAAALDDGISAIFEHFGVGRKPGTGGIDGNGDIALVLREGQQFGIRLAALLNSVPTRTGQNSTMGYILPESSWTRIWHFSAEQLLVNAERLISQPCYVKAYSHASFGSPNYSAERAQKAASIIERHACLPMLVCDPHSDETRLATDAIASFATDIQVDMAKHLVELVDGKDSVDWLKAFKMTEQDVRDLAAALQASASYDVSPTV